MALLEFLIPFGAALGFSVAASVMVNKNEFSTDIFLLSLSICVALFVWADTVPEYFIIISILIITGLFYKKHTETSVSI